jgi:hypothetical protein
VGLVAAIAETIGFILLVVPGLYLLTIWSVYTPLIVLERPLTLTRLVAAETSCAAAQIDKAIVDQHQLAGPMKKLEASSLTEPTSFKAAIDSALRS